MTAETSGSPLAGPQSVLDARQREVVARVSAAERAAILALPGDEPLDPKRRRRVEATLGEMTSQPEAVRATWAANEAALGEVALRVARLAPRRAFLVGAGDSLAVMIAARSALESMLGVPCEPTQSLDFAYYTPASVDDRTLVVALSSSGETTRTVEAALVAQRLGALTVALTNTPDSTLDQECDGTLLIRATRVGWPTQSSTAALALILRLAALVGVERGVAGAAPLLTELDAVPALMAETLAVGVGFAERLAEREHGGSMYLFSGAGPNWAAAIVGAAKVKECTPDHALAIQLEEYHHYNSQKAGEPLWVFAPSGPSVPRAFDTIAEARRFGGRAYVVTTAGSGLAEAADDSLDVPAASESLSPLLYLLPAQQAGYHLAMAKFAAAERSAR